MKLRRRIQQELGRTRDARRVQRVQGGLPAFWFTGRPNFGDLISPVVTAENFGVKPILVASSFPGKLLGAGSVLHRAVSGDIVWGSGLIQEQTVDGAGIEFLAVRGPRSHRCIRGDVPERYGDPGMLLPRVYTPSPTAARFDVGVLPHYHDKEAMRISDKSVLYIDVQDPDLQATVDRIASCDVLVTSSLHGIITADAYGIPVVWVQPTKAIKGAQFKFRDYFEGTNREGHLSDWSRGLLDVISDATAPPELDHSGLLQTSDAQTVTRLMHMR